MSRPSPARPSTDARARIAAELAAVEDELSLAFRWDRPLIVFVVCGAVCTRRVAQAVLADWLLLQGQRAEVFRVNGAEHVDVPLCLSRKRLRARSVYFVERLADGGMAALRALNQRREYLVDRQVRVVFWLNEQEESSLAQSAPDFWAFRHRVLYLP